jgi:uncharacterized protein YvpB
MPLDSRLSRRAFLLLGTSAIASGWVGSLQARAVGSPTVVGAMSNAADMTVPTPDAQAPTTRILEVPAYRQAYALSCEAASLRMALAYRGVTTGDASILDLIGSDSRQPFYQDGVLRWGDPYKTFVGDVTGSEWALTGYGTYYPTIAAAATALGATVLASGERITPQNVYAYVLDGHPAVTWVAYGWMAAARWDYVAFDGASVPYAGPVEHAVVVAGVNPTNVLINDPDAGQYWIPKSTFESAYDTYNQMAVVLG